MKTKSIIFVVGTTASGKSEWAMKLAQEFKGVIVNCDSVQVYSKVHIGAAKPSMQERAAVPHYLLDYVPPPQEMTAGQYSRDFEECLQGLPHEGPIFVVGGTGFYFMAIEKGMYPVKAIAPEIQQEVAKQLQEDQGPEKLLQEIANRDPQYAAKLHRADHYRIGRAVELIRTHGKGLTEIQKEFAQSQSKFPHPLLKIGPQWDRGLLQERILRRSEKMISEGLIGEVELLLGEGLADWAPLRSVGYKETVDFIRGHLRKEELIEKIATSTRQLAKRQRTWFQRDQEIQWFAGSEGFSEARLAVLNFLNQSEPEGI